MKIAPAPGENVPPDSHGQTGLRPQNVIAFLVIVGIALVLEWAANDLILAAWFALVCGVAAVAFTLVAREVITPLPGSTRPGFGEVILDLVLLTVFLVFPFTTLAHAFQQFHPDPDSVPDLGFFPYIADSFRYAAIHYWPMALVVSLEQAWSAWIAHDSIERKQALLTGMLSEFVRLFLLVFPLVFLHIFGLPRVMVVVALMVLLIPVDRIRSWLELDRA